LGAFALVYTKTADPIKSQFGADSCGPKEAGIRWGSRSDKSIHNVRGDKSTISTHGWAL